jgi:DNA helicase-2/ATP-dependent DNA helicase PcrA
MSVRRQQIRAAACDVRRSYYERVGSDDLNHPLSLDTLVEEIWGIDGSSGDVLAAGIQGKVEPEHDVIRGAARSFHRPVSAS